MGSDIYEKVLDLAKRRGFLYPAYDLYGGAAGFYDFGPLGSQLKARLESLFRRIYVVEEGAAEINTPAITVEPVLKASGHVDHFSDVVLSCQKCGGGLRADHFLPEELGRIRDKAHASPASPAFKERLATYVEAQVAHVKEHPSVAVAEEIRTTEVVEADGVVTVRASPSGARFASGTFVETLRCPTCGHDRFEGAANFNLMFKTHVGPGTSKVAYLRPETAQAMFVDFPYLYRYFREKLPFAVCQLGRAYRNEISPRQGLIRLREFNQMEVEAFFDPTDMTHPRFRKARETVLNLVPNTTSAPTAMPVGEAVKKKVVHNAALAYHLVLVHRLLIEAGLDPRRLRFRQHLKDEMAHYANDCWDAEYQSERFGWVECVGVADRGTYDLTQHAKQSGKALVGTRKFEAPRTAEVTKVTGLPGKLGPLFKKDAPRIVEALQRLDEAQAARAVDAPFLDVDVDGVQHRVPRDAYEVKRAVETVHGETFVPRVIEPSYGVDRILYAILEHNYKETQKEGEPYTVLALPPAMAPITVGVFPLMAKDGLDTLARKIEGRLRRDGVSVYYDDSGAIGRRYARADEAGTPFCVTVDHDSLKDRTVTLRDRDTTKQERVKAASLTREVRRRVVPRTEPKPAP